MLWIKCYTFRDAAIIRFYFRNKFQLRQFAVSSRQYAEEKGIEPSTSTKKQPNLIPFKSIPKEDLGFSILKPEANKILKKGVIFAKLCSLGSSTLGLCAIPLISFSLFQTLVDRPGVAAFMVIADALLAFFALTPLLLHFITKRFVENVYYNPNTKLFTTVHYNFLLRKRALRFTSDQFDPINASEKNKFSLQFATCTIHDYPLLLLLESEFYTDAEVFKLLTKNIKIDQIKKPI